MLYNRAMFKIYYTDPVSDVSHYTEGWRRIGMTFVTMVSEHPDSVGRPGVDSVVDGKTPDGVAYTWNKESRIGRTRK